ncbi:dephospho-CoA kinase [Pseudarthrobacter sp. BRE9]|uniref:dephospho-CoA kinase n=1 Tax=Pseudarthrobacter sp. BRE9 TaxID=2962582 RepID=UPI002881C651|nr:dephospho-CoA kinase [Pseudarthrobacter sp. BRE9]MDT0168574.1 dephospho-CoA kinase [Pseudarthrobacter sp. BRE9]
MLKIGLTGGIASGKSVVAARLKERGAVLVDADALAREVVEPGTEGLDRIVVEFGADMLDDAGRLDRARLGGAVFGNQERLAALNAIVHPLVRTRAAAITAAATEDAIVVQDIPLLVETGQGAAFHLVLVVDAPEDVRLQRMQELRGMTEEAAHSRMAAQATRDARLAAADVVLDNSGTVQHLLDQVDRLWDGRLVPFAHNLAAGTRAPRNRGPVLEPHRTEWAQQAARIAARLAAAAPGLVLAVDHIGSTSVPGLAAKDVIDLQVSVPDLEAAGRIAPLLAAAGFPAVRGMESDTPKPDAPDPSEWLKRFHANADPCRAVNVHVRAAGSAGWRYALLFRDWLRNDPAALKLYEGHKSELAARFAGSGSTGAYASAKEPWFTDVAWPQMSAWAGATGWEPPSYTS